MPLLLLLLILLFPGPADAQQGRATIRAGRLFDGRGTVREDVLLTIDSGRIVSVAAYTGQPVSIDLSRYTVTPGLIDVHVHVAWYFNRAGRLHTQGDGDSPSDSYRAIAANARAMLDAGFTTVQSVGSPEDRTVRDSIDAGVLAGPRILTAFAPLGVPNDPAALRAAVAQLEQQRADVIKVFAPDDAPPDARYAAQLLESLRAVCSAARAHGLRSIVHAHAPTSMLAASEAGCTQVEHGLYSSAATLEELAKRNTIFDPQCALIFRNYLENRSRYEGVGGFTAETFAWFERMQPEAVKVTRQALATRGLRVPYGTDAVAGAHGRNAEDLVCRVRQAGQSPRDALVSATSLAAESLGLGATIGTIAPGYEADIVAFDGNPLEDITAVRRVAFVMRAGRVISSPAR